MDEVRRLLVTVVVAAYKAAGAGEGCSYLVCPVTTGPREIRLMVKHNARDGDGLRTKVALQEWLEANGLWQSEFVDGVVRPNASDAAGHASRARQALRERGVTDLVIDPTYMDVRELGLALEPPLDVHFPRDAYLEINGTLYPHAQHLIVCPSAEYGSGMRASLVDAIDRGAQLMSPTGEAVTVEELADRVHSARDEMSSQGFRDAEVDLYIPPWRP